jgi:calcineurin-like phosphoesterase family protein
MKTWFISDHHFFHGNILNFKDKNGNLIRPGFDNVDHMNEFMIEKWNSVVNPQDKVYHLGDFLMRSPRKYFEEIVPKLNGRIVLIKGNHDLAKLSVYAEFFQDVRSEIHKVIDNVKVTFTHRPIRLGEETAFGRKEFNVHGHIHQNVIDDPRYLNVSVEAINYTPINYDEIIAIVRGRNK